MTSRPVVGWCADCFKELRRGMTLWTTGQDDQGNQRLICNDCGRLMVNRTNHSSTCPFRGDQRLALSA